MRKLLCGRARRDGVGGGETDWKRTIEVVVVVVVTTIGASNAPKMHATHMGMRWNGLGEGQLHKRARSRIDKRAIIFLMIGLFIPHHRTHSKSIR